MMMNNKLIRRTRIRRAVLICLAIAATSLMPCWFDGTGTTANALKAAEPLSGVPREIADLGHDGPIAAAAFHRSTNEVLILGPGWQLSSINSKTWEKNWVTQWVDSEPIFKESAPRRISCAANWVVATSTNRVILIELGEARAAADDKRGEEKSSVPIHDVWRFSQGDSWDPKVPALSPNGNLLLIGAAYDGLATVPAEMASKLSSRQFSLPLNGSKPRWHAAQGNSGRIDGVEFNVQSISFSGDGSIAAVGGRELWFDEQSGKEFRGVIQLIRTKDLTRLGEPFRTESEVPCLVIDNSGEWIVYGGGLLDLVTSRDNTTERSIFEAGAYVVRLDRHTERARLDPAIGQVRDLAISSCGKFVAMANSEGLVSVCDLHGVMAPVRFFAHTGAANSVCFGEDHGMLITCGDDGKVTVWQLEGLAAVPE